MRLRTRREGAALSYAEAGRPLRPTPWREASWCAVDLELTGLDPEHDHIVAIGTVPIEHGRVLLGQATYTLVNTTRRSEPAAVLVHKLRVDDLADAPPVAEATRMVLRALTGRVPVFHTAAVERAFLSPLLRRHRLRMPASADTEALGRLWLRGQGRARGGALSLTALANALGQSPEPAHHALGDAISTAQAFIALASHLDSEEPQTVGSLINRSQPPDTPRRLG